MSKAYKCDKCGDLVAEAKSCNTFAIKNYIYLNNQYQSSTGESIDLCIHCEVKVFEDVLEELKGELPKMDEEDLIRVPGNTTETVSVPNDGSLKYNYADDINDSYDVDPHVNDAYDNDDPDDLDLCK